MTDKQRMESDMATMNRREMADNTMRDHRDRNDGLTAERRFKADGGKIANKTVSDNRIRSDELTVEKRFKADRILEDNRVRNDETTSNRRETKDWNMNIPLAIFLGVLLVLAIGALFMST